MPDGSVKAKDSGNKYVDATFSKYTTPKIAKDSSGETLLLNGNEALARGCVEAGVRVAACYPGSPMHYTLENLVEAAKVYPSMHVEWSVNEKVAYEVAFGASLAGVRAMCTFKNVGLNVALDAIVDSTIPWGPGGLVIIVNEDPGLGSTTAEIDLRYLAMYCNIPVLDPSTMQECKDFTAAAFELSERIHLPVMVRPMYRQGYAREPVLLSRIQHEVRERAPHYDPKDYRRPEVREALLLHQGPTTWIYSWFHGEVPPPEQKPAKEWATLKGLEEAVEAFEGNKLTISEESKVGVVSSGLVYQQAMEALKGMGWPKEVAVLKLATSYPVPKGMVKKLLQKTKTILVAEETEPVIENQIRSIAAGMKRHAEVRGKLTGDIPFPGEITRKQIGPSLARILGREYAPGVTSKEMQQRHQILHDLAPEGRMAGGRCPGCPGTAAGYALKNAAEQLGIATEVTYFGYDGCCGGGPVGATIPYLCMGAGLNILAGLHHAGIKGKKVSLCGDSNFFHSTIPSLIESIYNKSDVLFYVMDNSTTAMTGHQPHPGGFGVTATGEPTKILDIAEICRACQADFVAVVDPYDQKQAFDALKQALTTKGVSVVVSRRICAVVAQRQKGARDALIFDAPSQVDREKCLSWTVQMSPCEARCPAHMNVEAYLRAIAKGDFSEALEVMMENNPFPATLGRVCPHPCEEECKRGDCDDPMAIAHLKRFVADYALSNGLKKISPVPITHKEKIAIVGAGPAGLTAAYDLIRKGYPVTVFEASEIAGGMLSTSIPEFILPQKIVQSEIDYIRELGVEIKTSTPIGKDLTLDSLKKDYKAIFLATGAQKSARLPIPGTELRGVMYALPFLRDVKLGKKVNLSGKRVVVIGGGNVAMDVARTALRLGADVELACLESRVQMPAWKWEIESTEEEGAIMHPSLAPQKIRGRAGRVTGIDFKKVATFNINADRRISWTLKEGPDTEVSIDADCVIIAIGQAVEPNVLTDHEVDITQRGTFLVDPLTLATNKAGIFAGGDAVKGQGTVIESIAEGHEAAISIERYLKGEDLKEGRKKDAPVTGKDTLPKTEILEREREEIVEMPVYRRVQGFDEVKLGYTVEQAMAEAERCLRCKTCRRCIEDFACVAIVSEDGHPTIDRAMCAGCNVCDQVCPYGNIQPAEVKK